MGFLEKIKSGCRTVVSSARDGSGWERDLALISIRENDLPLAVERGLVPEGTVEYALEIITLTIKGKTIAKTRCQWAEFNDAEAIGPPYTLPYRSGDSDKTKGVIVHNALLDLVSLNKAHPDLSLHELLTIIQKKYWD